MDLMFAPLRKYAQFSGRARRKEYWLFWLLLIMIELVFFTLISLAGGNDSTGQFSPAAMGVALIFVIIFVAMIVPSLAVMARRLHDINHSAWWMLIAFVPGLGALVLFVFSVLPGTTGDNRFGPDPKADEDIGLEREPIVT